MAVMMNSVNIDYTLGPMDEFTRKYQIRDFRIEHQYSPYSYSHSHSQYSLPRPGDSIVTITLSELALEALVRTDQQSDKLLDQYRHEEFIRRRCPAVQKAWEEYQLLLELSR
jgi:hypothetical protein